MFIRIWKALVLFFVMWLVSMMTVEYNFKYKHSFLQHKKKYVIKRIKSNASSKSAFQVWRSFKPAPQNLSYEDKLEAIKDSYNNYPPGENGTAVSLEDDLRHFVRIQVQKGWRDHAFNQFVSDIIPVGRNLPDVRHDWCKKQTYSNSLPNVSIIICFHNEAWSTLIRTLRSVLDRSPQKLINEVILFDDYSTMAHLGSRLEEYVRKQRKVVLVRSSKREGLIRARLKAIEYAKSSVLVFLDSHCECTKGWLEPLVERIANNPSTVASPAVDIIDDRTFEYIAQDTNNLRIGGFNWELKFVWMRVPQQISFARKKPAAPINTPTISGGLFAINKAFFEKIGLYDEEFDIWGGENLELSFKTWMCGGSLEIVPCSHVGHVFRRRMPYKTGDHGALNRNLLRVAEIWMDDYKKYFLERIGNPRIYLKDVSSRKQLRDNLKCKSFQWYLKNVFPQLEIPDKYAASGQIYNVQHNMCLDLSLSEGYTNATVELYRCHNNGANQFWVYTRHGQIKRHEFCLEYIQNVLQMFLCGGKLGYQRWLYNNMTQLLKHTQTKKCLQMTKTPNGFILTMNKCTIPSILEQKWTMEKFIFERLDPDLYTN